MYSAGYKDLQLVDAGKHVNSLPCFCYLIFIKLLTSETFAVVSLKY